MRALAAFALLLAALTSAGCHKSATEVCNKGCEKAAACLGGSQQSITDCERNSNCEAQDNNPNGCTNDSFNAQTDCLDNCLAEPCGTSIQCALNCPKCIRP